MEWITRSHVHVDRVACPWLNTRSIDSDAEFSFVAKSKVLEMVEKEGAKGKMGRKIHDDPRNA